MAADSEPPTNTRVPAASAGARRAGPRPGLVLIQKAGEPACRAVALGAAPLRVGRARDADLAIEDDDVSGRHAEISLAGWGVAVEDRSKNGTYVDGARIDGRGEARWEAVLAVGSSLLLVVPDVTPFERRGPTVETDHLGQHFILGPRHAASLEAARAAGENGLSLFITGESGAGKEQMARAYHAATGRRGRFEDLNATTVNAELAESQLFGHKRGAFSGADRDQKGKLVLAHGGTLFFDEIGDMHPDVQPKLLRVLQDGRVTPVGAEQAIRVDLRFVSATNRDVRALIAAGRFREDLYVRLAEIHVHLRPLRERREEIPLLVRVALRQLADRRGRPAPPASADFVAACAARAWRGQNVRGLLHAVRAAAVAAESAGAAALSPEHLPTYAGESAAEVPAEQAPPDAAPTRETSATGESPVPAAKAPLLAKLRAALARNGGSLPKAAEEAGIPRSTAYWVWKRWGG